MGTHVESFPARHTARNIGVTLGVLALLGLAIGTGVAIGRATVEEPAPPPANENLAAPAVVRTVDAHIAALNSADRAAIAAFYSRPYAVFTDAEEEWVGANRIAGALTRPRKFLPLEWGLERVGDVFQFGDATMYAFTSDRAGPGLTVLRLDINRQIVHQWITNDPDIPSFILGNL